MEANDSGPTAVPVASDSVGSSPAAQPLATAPVVAVPVAAVPVATAPVVAVPVAAVPVATAPVVAVPVAAVPVAAAPVVAVPVAAAPVVAVPVAAVPVAAAPVVAVPTGVPLTPDQAIAKNITAYLSTRDVGQTPVHVAYYDLYPDQVSMGRFEQIFRGVINGDFLPPVPSNS